MSAIKEGQKNSSFGLHQSCQMVYIHGKMVRFRLTVDD